MPTPRRGVAERLAAWAITGPPGHLWSAAADLGAFWARALAHRIVAGAGRRSSRRR